MVALAQEMTMEPYEEHDERRFKFWGGKRVLITGATGFVGTWMTSYLSRWGAHVSAIIRDADLAKEFFEGARHPYISNIPTMTVSGDISDYQTVERAIVESWPDVIFHLAAVTQVVDASRMPLQNYQTNIMGTVNILEAVNHHKIDTVTVIASSDKAYGKTSGIVDENSRLNPVHPYDTSKACADMIARSYAGHYGQNLAVTRCGNIYGPGDNNWQRLVPSVINDVINDRPPVLRSDGKHIREYNYVSDIVNAYLLVAEALLEERIESGIAWTISDEDAAVSVMEMVSHIQKIAGTNFTPIIQNRTVGEEHALRLNSALIRDRLGWKPEIKLSTGLGNTIDWAARHTGFQRKASK